MEKHTLLIIDDDIDICMLLKRLFERKGYNVRIALKGVEGINKIKNEPIDLVLTDFRLPDRNGFEMIEIIQTINDKIPIIVITGYSEVNQAVKAIRLGAYDYVTKPIFPEEILMLVEDALKKYNHFKQIDPSVSTDAVSKEENKAHFLIPPSSYSQGIQRLINIVAPTDMTVVITGESGTGKEVVARM